MGGGPTERILFILPFPEPKDLLKNLLEKFPNIEITWFHNKVTPTHHGGVPKGELDDLFKGKKEHGQLQEKQLQEKAGEVAKPSAPTVSKDVFRDKTILMTLTVLPESRADAPNLKLVHLFSAGSDRAVQSPLFRETEIVFTNSSGVHGPQITEWVIMTLLVNNHKYNAMYESQKLHRWDRQWAWGLHDLVGQRIGILGYGAIGRQVAHVTKAMGMQVYAYTATPKPTREARRDHGYIVPGTGDPDGSIPTQWFSGLDKQSLHDFLSQKLDVLLVSVPLTKETTHLLSHDEFALLSQHPPLVSNIARGPIIDQAALVAALHSGAVRAATLDVTDPEPLPETDPLWTAPNVIITPHISGASSAYLRRSLDVLGVNLGRLSVGGELVNVISRRKGY